MSSVHVEKKAEIIHMTSKKIEQELEKSGKQQRATLLNQSNH